MNENQNDFVEQELARAVLSLDAATAGIAPDVEALVAVAAEAIERGGKIILFGNGGSAMQAQHIAAELVIRYGRNRAPIPAIALTADTAVLTAGANDLGYETVFARQVEAIGKAGDLAIGISTSGESKNVLNGLAAARKNGLSTFIFAGRYGTDLTGAMLAHRRLTDDGLGVRVAETPRIQEAHLVIGHVFCAALERRLGLLD